MKYLIYLSFVIISTSSLIWGCEKTQFVCYYGSWAKYRQGIAKFQVSDIDPFVCTHVVYTFLGLDQSSGKVIYLDSYADLSDEWHKGGLDLLQDLKKENPELKLMVAIGGWNEGSEKYSQVCADAVKRRNLITTAIDVLERHNLDGWDFDWEYPAQRGGAASDRECFTLLLKEFKEELARRGKPEKILSCAVSANAISIPQSYDCAAVSRYVDFINVMTYDLHGSWEATANHHTALAAHSCENPAESHLNSIAAIQSWIDNGADPCKINMGMASYGRSYQLSAATSSCQVCAPARGPYPAGEEVGESGFYSYREICRKIKEKGWRVCYSDEQSSPYVSHGDLWVGYDDPASITLKTIWAKKKGLAGVFIWSIETDDHTGICGQGKYPLCNAIKSAWFSDGNFTNPPWTTTNAPATTTTIGDSTTTTSAAPQTTTDPSATTTENPNPTGTTPSPTSTAEPNTDNQCTEGGAPYYRDDTDCSVFYKCDPGQGFKAHRFQCQSPLYFDLKSLTCNWPYLVEGCY